MRTVRKASKAQTAPEAEAFLRARAEGGRLPERAPRQAARRFGRSLGQIERTALDLSLVPLRYQRNLQAISAEQQARLLASRVAVVGCGGLGGYVIEELCRLGVGTIAAFDPDRFEENNLNRQLLCNDRALGTPKVAAARQRARQVNPAVELVAVRAAVGRRNGARLLKGYQVVVDALDSIAGRLELAEVCQALGVPLVHGSVGGWYGQVAVQFPGEQTLPRIYGANGGGRGAEKELGVLAFAPALVASLEAAEACKLLLGVGAPLRGRMLYVDLLAMKVVEARI